MQKVLNFILIPKGQTGLMEKTAIREGQTGLMEKTAI
jgi:hypothetical protein